MAVLNVTLDSLKFANTDGFLRDFGTKKTRDQNGGSLTTRECNENVAKIFDTQRPFYVSEDSETSDIEFSATFVISNGVKLTLGDGSFPGVEVKILSGDNSAVIAGQKEYILPLNGFTKFFWTGTSWNYTSFSPTQTSVQSINLNDEFPIMQDGETKKVKFETLTGEIINDNKSSDQTTWSSSYLGFKLSPHREDVIPAGKTIDTGWILNQRESHLYGRLLQLDGHSTEGEGTYTYLLLVKANYSDATTVHCQQLGGLYLAESYPYTSHFQLGVSSEGTLTIKNIAPVIGSYRFI